MTSLQEPTAKCENDPMVVMSDPAEDPADEDDYSFDSTAAVPQTKLQRPNNLTIPELLAMRESFGHSSLRLPRFSRPRQLHPDVLSSKIAWNPSRLQNMILVCGPGTPAAMVDLSKAQAESNSGPSPPAAAAAAAARLGSQEDSSSSSEASETSESLHEGEGISQSQQQQEEENSPAVAHARTGSSGSSSTTASGTKRTLSDHLKNRESDKQQKHDMNLDTTSSSDSDDEEIKQEEKESDTKAPSKREQWTKKFKTDNDNTAEGDKDENMMGFSDIEEEICGKDGKDIEEKKEAYDSEDQKWTDHGGETAKNAPEHSSEMDTDGGTFDNSSGSESEQHSRTLQQLRSEGIEGGSEDDEEMRDFREMAAEWFSMEQAELEEAESVDDSDDDDDDDDDADDSDAEARAAARLIIRRRILRRSPSPGSRNRNNRRTMKPALRHGGCINTAAWLQAGWRLSTVSPSHYDNSLNANAAEEDGSSLHALLSEDCPTQLVTSGDDRLVKFWDARHAIGSANPLPHGRNTVPPFAWCAPPSDGYRAKWHEHYLKQPQPVEPWKIAGNVMPLASLSTGHRGNVFHVTPLWKNPGKVVTCGADGYLRLGDVEANSASIIISPEYFDDGSDRMMAGLFSLRPGMCFSHHFLNSNVGLLCSERGLRKFDIRLPPREQDRTALLGGDACKSCAIWSVSSASSIEEVDSSYIFVGGTGSDISFCDLRMTGSEALSERARIVHTYRPSCFSENNENISVSGLDLSRDKSELLVSYESDQIYTFPVFPYAKSAAGPTLQEIDSSGVRSSRLDKNDSYATNGSMEMLNGSEQKRSSEDFYYHELACYGGHLNRFTFLKNAKYAGPNDEYICTGSDSGHAWIYDRSTGAVVSLLNADHSTCNGIIPHPSLPIFITYGIDSTAKLWRGTRPVDPDADDSPSGRANSLKESPYEMSPLAREWESIQQEIASLEEDIKDYEMAKEANDSDATDEDIERSEPLNSPLSLGLLPDQVLSRKELISSGSFGRSILRRFYGGSTGSTRIGNDLHSLPDVLRRNLYECIRTIIGSSYGRRNDYPIESDIKELMRRVSFLRLRHQADRQGISGHWNASLPWIMGSPSDIEGGNTMDKKPKPDDNLRVRTHPAELIPDHPSDWIPYDPEMSPSAKPCGISFNVDEYGDYYRTKYLHSDKKDWGSCVEDQTGLSWIWAKRDDDQEMGEHDTSASENALRILYETAKVLKEAGNEALRDGELETAARRYDKTIRYCSVAFIPEHSMATFSGENKHDVELLERRLADLEISPGLISPMMLRWTPLLKVLISTRLNMSMLLLKRGKRQQEFTQPDRAADQARRALRELQPFCVEKGKIILTVSKSDGSTRLGTSANRKTTFHTKVLRKGEPEENYIEAKKLQLKAFFRLGSAEMEMGDYAEAIKSFEISIEYAMELDPEAKLDPLVLRRLGEAKRAKKQKSKRRRKKFRKMFAASQEEEKEEADSDNEEKEQEPATSFSHVRDIPDDRRDRRQDTRHRTTGAPFVTPPSQGPSSRTAMEEEQGTQSE